MVRGVGNQIEHKKHDPTRNLKRNQKKSVGLKKNAVCEAVDGDCAASGISSVGLHDNESVVDADGSINCREEELIKQSFEDRRQLFKTSKFTLAEQLLQMPHYHDFDKVATNLTDLYYIHSCMFVIVAYYIVGLR